MNINDIRQAPHQATILRQTQKRATAAPFDAQVKQAPESQSKQTTVEEAREQPSALTASEKEYFEQLYPSSAEEVRTYNPYQRGGIQTTVKLGSHIDRKG